MRLLIVILGAAALTACGGIRQLTLSPPELGFRYLTRLVDDGFDKRRALAAIYVG